MKVVMKQSDINRGQYGDPHTCAVANAIARILHINHKKIFVTCYGNIDINGKIRYFVGKDVVSFISKFDLKQKVKPITFELTNAKQTKTTW